MPSTIQQLYQLQKENRRVQATTSVKQRISLLKALKQEIEKQETAITKALQADFQKPALETMLSEVIVVY